MILTEVGGDEPTWTITVDGKTAWIRTNYKQPGIYRLWLENNMTSWHQVTNIGFLAAQALALEMLGVKDG